MADLGGLGAKEGKGVAYSWTSPGLGTVLVPWLGILGLLLLKANRSPAAWLIWVPLLAVLPATLVLRPALDFMPSGMLEAFLEAIVALGLGLGVVWLVGHRLRRQYRILTWLLLLVVLGGSSLLVYAVGRDWDEDWSSAAPALLLLGLSVLVVSLALGLAGLCCRGRYRPAPFFAWLVFWLPAVWLALATPFFLFALMASGGEAPWGQFLVGILVMAGVNLTVLVPFVILSVGHPFYRERLADLLHVRIESVSDLPAPPPDSGTS
jgi:hypothetical protein